MIHIPLSMLTRSRSEAPEDMHTSRIRSRVKFLETEDGYETPPFALLLSNAARFILAFAYVCPARLCISTAALSL